MKNANFMTVALTAAIPFSALAADAPATTSPLTFNIGVVSDYIVRGITQTVHKSALQGGVDYAHPSGLYAGGWGSNVSWIKDSGAIASGDASVELDTYVGFKNSFADVLNYDVGYIRYNFLGSYQPSTGFNNADTAEVYAATTYKWVTLKYSYSLLDGFLTTPGTKGTNYLDLSASYTFSDSGVTVGAHYGKQTFVGTTTSTTGDALSYSDYKLNVSKDFSGYVLGLTYTNTNTSPAWIYNGENWGRSAVSLSATHSF